MVWDAARGRYVDYEDRDDDYGTCPKCGGVITYPPLCDNKECDVSWDAYGKALAAGPDPDLPDDLFDGERAKRLREITRLGEEMGDYD